MRTEHTLPSEVRIGHVHLRVSDLARATAFYRDLLGFKVVIYGPAFGLPAAFLAAGDYHHHIALNTCDSAGAPPPAPGHTGLQHVAILYPDRAALSQAVRRLFGRRYPIDYGRDHGGTLSVYLKDPDGNGLELYCDRPRKEWFDAQGRPTMKNEPFEVQELLADEATTLTQRRGHTNMNTHMKHFRIHALVAAFAFLSCIAWFPFNEPAQAKVNRAFGAPVVFQAAGPNVASVQGVVEQFRVALGGANNLNAPGPLVGGRREINWDGGGSSATALAGTPFNGFLTTRGAQFSTDGEGFVQAPLGGLATTFGNLSYDHIFQPFSQLRLFSPVGSNVTDVAFFIPGGGFISATTTGFGAIFSDVDQPDGSGPAGKRGNRGSSTLVEYYGTAGNLLFSSFVPASPGDGSLSFLGVIFEDPQIAQVRITTGDALPSLDDEPNRDVVMMDDFVFGEPRIGQ